MNAGRELDALVAEKVMGLKPGTEGCWYDPASSYGGQLDLPHFSTDIAAAWTVVEKLAVDGWHPTVGLKVCLFTKGSVDDWGQKPTQAVQAKGDTAPLAICLAALKAVEGK